MQNTDYESLRLLFELLITALAAVLWWNFRTLAGEGKDTVKEVGVLKEQIAALRLLVATECVKHSDIEKLLDKMDSMSDRFDNKFEKVFDLIGQKADKS